MIDKIQESLVYGKKDQIIEDIKKALDLGISATDILNEGLVKGMDEIGKRWSKNEIFIPEVLIAARAMNAAMHILQPVLKEKKTDPKGVVVIGTVQGDLHDIGKNLVGMMLKGKGFEVVDLGVNVPANKFIEAVELHDAKFVCISSLLTTTMLNITDVIKEFKRVGLYDNVTIACGGAPVNQAFADEAGCHIYEKDAVGLSNRFSNIVIK